MQRHPFRCFAGQFLWVLLLALSPARSAVAQVVPPDSTGKSVPGRDTSRFPAIEVRHFLPEESRPDDPPFIMASTAAISLPAGFYLEDIVPGNSFSTPVGVAFAPDGRIFVVEKRGRVYIVDNGVKLSTPFIDIESEVLNHWDRGLLGFTLDPDFETNGFVYLLYTFDWDGSGDYTREDVASRLTRFTVDANDPNIVDPATRHVLIGETYEEGIPSCYYSHSIGTLQFGSDGTLFSGAGDGGHFGQIDAGGLQPDCFGPGKFPASEDIGAFRAQSLSSLAGKILRIDPATGLGLPSNPFYTGNPADHESMIWSLGLRNPYRFTVRKDGSTDPADGEPGTVIIGDVGWNTWDDIHISYTGGENFGWPCYEGPNPHNNYQNQTPAHSDCSTISGQDLPVYYWHHSNPVRSNPPGLLVAAIIVGDIYTGSKYPPSFANRIFYADYTRGWIASASVDAANNLSDQQTFATDAGPVVDIRYDPVSEYMYYVDVAAGKVWRVRHDDENAPPVALASSDVRDGYAPLLVQFAGDMSFDPDTDPITYHWSFGDGDTSDVANPSHTYLVDGVYTVALTVTDDNDASSQTFLEVAVGNTYPTAQIITPGNGSAVKIGQTISLSAVGLDAEDGPGALGYEWSVTQRHNTHNHPEFFESNQQNASFEAEEHGLASEVSYLRIRLIVTDTGGLRDTTEHVVEVERRGEQDVTYLGTPVALVTSPTGSGNPDISVISDGVFPAAGTADPSTQYDTFDGVVKSIDWIGYTFPEDRYLSKLTLQQGIQSGTGGWFESLDVEVRVDGVWESVGYLNFLKPYEGDNGSNFDRYTLVFEGVWADGIRLIGVPGGTGHYVSVGELRVFELPVVDFAASVTSGVAPLEVSFTDASSVAGAWTWSWDFGDGHTSADSDPTHMYTAAGGYDVTLSITGPAGAFATTKQAHVVVGEPGLIGQYFDNMDFTGTRLVRTDALIDFDWASASPDPSMGVDQFSTRWTGWIRPEHSETYTFHSLTDDGVRLWIDGQVIIDQWIPQSPTEWTGTISLLADRYYPITMEYYEDAGGAVASLDWSSASQTRETIPTARMRTGTLAPRVASFNPASGDYLETVHIVGENLSGVSAVSFGGHAASSFGVVSAGHIWAVVPPTATTGSIEVQTPDGTSVTVQEFGVNDGTLPVELPHFGGVATSAGVRLSWTISASSSVVGFGVEHAAPGVPDYQELAFITRSYGTEEFDFQSGVNDPGLHRFRLRVTDTSGETDYSQVIEVPVELVSDVRVEAPFPNPFSASARVTFAVGRPQHVDVALYDMLGRRLQVLYSGEPAANEPVTLLIDGSRPNLPSGLYVIRFKGEFFVSDRRITRVGAG